MKTPTLLFLTAIFACFMTSAAAAQHRHHHRRHIGQKLIVCDARGCSDRVTARTRRKTDDGRNAISAASAIDANGNTAVVGGRPSDCPYEFCGCEASRYVFGEIRRELNLASNWIRRFPRTAPARGMAAVRNHHVMILMSRVSGNDWLVHDGNSGGHLTREHVRSIAGYVIVDPHGSRSASTTE